MPSKKAISTIIICISTILSVWILLKEPKASISSTDTLTAYPYINDKKNTNNDDWKKLFNIVDSKAENVTSVINTKDNFDDTTVTAQMSRDFMSQYLLLKQNGKNLTEDEMKKIILNLFDSGEYTKVNAPTYILSNLNITSKNDTETKKKYKREVTLIFKNRGSQLGEDPVLFLNQLVGKQRNTALAHINGTIGVGRSFIEDFLKIEVPNNAISIHLVLLNSVSMVISDLEAIREINDDPVRSLVALQQYGKDFSVFQASLKKMISYLSVN